MQVKLDYNDMAEIYKPDNINVGVYCKAREAVQQLQKLPWTSADSYVETVLSTISKFYDEIGQREK